LQTYTTVGRFTFEAGERTPVGSVLLEEHLKLTDRSHMAPFAGYLMPLWYSSISNEHRAVRESAGLFDCTHMGALEVTGPQARPFLNTVSTNHVDKLAPGRAQYGQVLDAAGAVIDDIIIFCRSDDCFMVVVNAANDAKVQAYFSALTSGKLVIDPDDEQRTLDHRPAVRDMRNVTMLGDCRVNLALQGPRAVSVLKAAGADDALAEQLMVLAPFHFVEGEIGGIDCLISRTGYTGAQVGFEVFVHPARAVEMWRRLLHKGVPVGLVPCGLGSRDSLRVEAGFPLYGHELAGRHNISPIEAGYGWAVKLDKPFFVGKTVMAAHAAEYDMQVMRGELPGDKGIRPAKPDDGVLDANGRCIGWVTSCAHAGRRQCALLYVERGALREGDTFGVYYAARRSSQAAQGRKEAVGRDEMLTADISGTVVSRFAKF